jgi:uncharacterized membrane protein YcaP (DUF421 family)
MEIVARAAVTFVVLFLLTRGLRKRTLADLAPFELLLLVTIGDIVQQGITQEDYSLTGSILVVATFGLMASVLTWASWRSDRARKLIDGVPIVLVRDGRPIDVALELEQMPLAELEEAARQSGVADLDDVRLAVLEPNGRISIIKTEGSSS